MKENLINLWKIKGVQFFCLSGECLRNYDKSDTFIVSNNYKPNCYVRGIEDLTSNPNQVIY